MTQQGDNRHTVGSAGNTDHADHVRRRAYELYVERGGQHGNDFDDWVTAEREVSLRAEPETVTERVNADAGVLGEPAPGDVTTDGAPAPAAAAAPSKAATTSTARGVATKPSTPPAGKQASSKAAPVKATPSKAAPTKVTPTKAAAKGKPAPGTQPPADGNGTV